jgi:hypothetical protein
MTYDDKRDFWKNESYRVSMSLNDHNPFDAPGGLFEPPREAKNLEVDTLGLEPL